MWYLLNASVTARVPKYRVFSSPYFPVFGLNAVSVISTKTRQYGPEKTPYLDTFHAVSETQMVKYFSSLQNTNEAEVMNLFLADENRFYHVKSNKRIYEI